MTVLGIALLTVLTVAGAGCVVRAVRGPTVVDRVVALDTLSVTIAVGIIVYAATNRTTAYLDLAVLVGLVGFVTVVTVARFVERSGP